VVHRAGHAAGTARIAHVSTGTATFVTEATIIAGTVVANIPIIAGAIGTYVASISAGAIVTYVAGISAGAIVAYVAGISAGTLATIVVANRTNRAARATATGISGVCRT
jgi:mannitol-specific phosphotransferase system IIBC component